MGRHMRSLLPQLLRRGLRMVFSFFRRNSTALPKASIETETTHMAPDAEGAADINLVSDEEDSAASLPPMTAFDIVVVGAGGGPDESNLSAYVFSSPEMTFRVD